MDVEKIRLGDKWREALRHHIQSADYVLVVIGRQWLDVRDEQGRRRLDVDGDFVRWEIAEAIDLGKMIVPVQVDGAAMPTAADLPADIARLPDFQGQTLSHRHFEDEIQALIARFGGDHSASDLVQRLQRRLRMGWASLVVAVIGMVLAASFAWVNLFDLLGLDTRSANFTMLIGDVLQEPPISDELLLVGIVPEASESAGLNPERRLQYARLIDAAVAQGANRVVFDITLVGESEHDAALDGAIRRAQDNGVGVAFGFNALERGAARLPQSFAGSGALAGLTCVGERLGNVTYGTLVLQSGQGVFGSLPFYAAFAPVAIDGLPTVGTLQRFRDRSGSLAEVRFSLRETVSVPDADCPARMPGSELARLIVRLSHKERWRDPVRRIGLEDLIASESPAIDLQKKTLLVGAEHPGDTLKTRLDGTPSRFGFEFHADVTNALLTGRVVQPVSFTAQWLFAAAAIGLAVAWRWARLGKARHSELLVLSALCAMLVTTAVVLYANFGWLVDSLYHLVALVVTWWVLAALERRWSGAVR